MPALPPTGAHQERAINAVMDRAALLVEYGTGCIAGDASITYNRAGIGRTATLAYVVRMYNGGRAQAKNGSWNGPKWNPAIPTYVQREQEGVVRLVRLTGAWCSGIKPTYQVRTESGRVIRATAEHPFLTERGWLRLEELAVGDRVHVRGPQATTGRGPKPRYTDVYRLAHHPYATRHHRKDRPTDSYTVTRHRLVAEADLNGLEYDEFLKRIRSGVTGGLTFLDPEKYEVHHRDRDPKNDLPVNLQILRSSDHPRLHAEEGTYKNVLFKIQTEAVVSVEPYGDEMTYDLEVADDPHNFIANGFVVHNTGKSRIYVEAIEALVMAGDVPILVLVPNSLIEQTTEEFELWLGVRWVEKHLTVLDSTLDIGTRRDQLKYNTLARVFILSHEALSYPLIKEGLTSRKWAAIFVDEASRFRNHTSRTTTLIAAGKRAALRYALTGNLAPRTPADVWYVMNWIQPGLFGTKNKQNFVSDYCLMGGYSGSEPTELRPDRIEKFKAIMDGYRISCDLSDVRDMPERILHVAYVNMPEKTRTAYREMQETLRLEIERVDDATFESQVTTYATRLQRLQEITSGFARNIDGDIAYLPSGKTSEMIDRLQDEPDTPTIIWGWWIPEMRNIEAHLEKYGIPYVTYDTKPGNTARQRFMAGEVNVFVCQLAKGGYGLNLTRATRMIYHSLPWSLDTYLQSQERNLRLTTTAPRLEVVHLTTRRSVDEYVRNRLLARADVSAQLTRSQALELLRK